MKQWHESILFLILPVCIGAIIALSVSLARSEAARDDRVLYPMTAIVREIDRESDAVCVEDPTGNLWVFEGAEDWEIGDMASLIMDSKDTQSIYDDEIVTVRYCGF